MLILSIDIETTSIDPEKGQLLSLGAVAYNSLTLQEVGTFHGCVNYGEFYGEPVALSMNSSLLMHIARNGADVFPDLMTLFKSFGNFLEGIEWGEHPDNKITLCGKNFLMFDEKWLDNKCQEVYGMNFRKSFSEANFGRRYLDVGPMFAKMSDSEIPNLSECMLRAGIDGTVTHNALQDARDVLNCAIYKLDENEKR